MRAAAIRLDAAACRAASSSLLRLRNKFTRRCAAHCRTIRWIANVQVCSCEAFPTYTIKWIVNAGELLRGVVVERTRRVLRQQRDSIMTLYERSAVAHAGLSLCVMSQVTYKLYTVTWTARRTLRVAWTMTLAFLPRTAAWMVVAAASRLSSRAAFAARRLGWRGGITNREGHA